MNFSLIELISRLNFIELSVLFFAGIVGSYFVLAKKLHILIFLLIISAALVGTTLPVLDNIAALGRWLLILLFVVVGILQSRYRISLGIVLFWGYVFLGLLFLIQAENLSWQLQRGILLLLVSLAIPLAYSIEEFKTIKLSLTAIAIAAVIFASLNFISLPTSLTQAVRYTGFSKGAPTFVIVLGGLLPFTIWGVLRADNKIIRIVCVFGFLFGITTLFFSGQRTGTLAGLVSIIPFMFLLPQRKSIVWYAALLILIGLAIFTLFQIASEDKINFLLSRYSPNSGLSYRDLIWANAVNVIGKSPFIGHGIGAAETVMSYSFHNAYLEVWYNAGLLGLFLFISSQCYFFYRIYYLNKLNRDPESKAFLALSLGYMMGFVFISLFESIGAGASNLNLILYLLIGVVLSGTQVLVEAKSPQAKTNLIYQV